MNGIPVGFRDLHWAELLKDDETGVEYGEPIKIAGAIEGKTSPKSETVKLDADDGTFATNSKVSGADVELNVADLPLSVYAKILGKKVVKGQVLDKTTDSAPYGAIMYRISKDNGKSRYSVLYKMKFEQPDEEAKTSGEKMEYQTAKIKGTSVNRQYDNAWRNRLDEDEPDFDQDVAKNWFKEVPKSPEESVKTSGAPARKD
ncbi:MULTISPECIES: major tail protein [Bacillus cereus group]|uniref:Phage tail protein n=1 Tax=Bacillus paranthracis TaxID=2026186 RepID=A0A9X8SCR1_9BACI|nr:MULTISPECIES: major tail protein [Bacillus cereus group]EJQ03676.1 phi13 family phage major tail protein [Bacillus cereus AND1407]KMP84701.1 tail protein [Bacillus cereus]KMQ32815.1 tail protein [Bacillus cereus]MBE7133895.1 phage tail protein [Bacillus paranthracis]MCC2358943.1 phage tail protein [Bacillus paranthracis]